MRLSDSVEGRLVAAKVIAIVTEQEAIQTLTLLAACLRQPSAMGSELLLAKGFSATGVSSFLRMGKSYETSVTIVRDSMLTDEAAAVLAAADRGSPGGPTRFGFGRGGMFAAGFARI